MEHPGFEPGTHVVPSAFAAKWFKIPLPRLRRRSVEKHVCCSVQLSYRTREGARPGLEPGTHRLHVVPPAFAAGILRRWRQQLARGCRTHCWAQPQASNLLAFFDAYHVLPPAFASEIPKKPTKKRPRRFIETGYVVPASIRLPSINRFEKGRQGSWSRRDMVKM